MNLQILIPLCIYLASMYLFAFYSKRKISASQNKVEEYFIGSRGLSGFLLAMTLVGTYVSASSFIGGPGIAYKIGLGWVFLAMIQVPASALVLGILGKRYAIIARRVQAVSISDILYARYKSTFMIIFSCLALIVFFIVGMTAQFIGGARLIQGVTGISYTFALLIFSSTVLIYTTIGGFRAVALTDALQGIVMIFGTFLLLGAICYQAGSLHNIFTSLRNIDPALLTPQGPNHFLREPYLLSFWVLICFGVIGLPQLATRCFAYKNSKALHQAIIMSTIILGIVILSMHLCGVFGRAIIPNLVGSSDIIMPKLFLKVLPPILVGIFLAAPIAAIMSTIDSQLLLATAALINDVYYTHYKKKKLSGHRVIRISAVVSMLIGIIVIFAALNPPDFIVWLNLFAFGGLQSVFFWPLIGGMYYKKGSPLAANCAMVGGILVFLILEITKYKIFGLHSIVPTFVISGVLFFVISKINPYNNKFIENLFWNDEAVN